MTRLPGAGRIGNAAPVEARTHLSPDGSRDLRIEDPTNRWLIHPLSRAALPLALRAGISANAVSVAGFLIGTGAAWCFTRWPDPAAVLAGSGLAIAWLVADGLDGMIGRAPGTAGPLGRFMDGICDHGVFVLMYVGLAISVGTATGWVLAVAAGAAHAIQSSLFEGERARFHRRSRGVPAPLVPPPAANRLVRTYDSVATSLDRLARPFEAVLAASPDPRRFGAAYAARALAPMRLMIPLSANTRVWGIAAACLLGDPRLFWSFELGPLSALALAGIAWHRRVERASVAA